MEMIKNQWNNCMLKKAKNGDAECLLDTCFMCPYYTEYMEIYINEFKTHYECKWIKED